MDVSLDINNNNTNSGMAGGQSQHEIIEIDNNDD